MLSKHVGEIKVFNVNVFKLNYLINKRYNSALVGVILSESSKCTVQRYK